MWLCECGCDGPKAVLHGFYSPDMFRGAYHGLHMFLESPRLPKHVQGEFVRCPCSQRLLIGLSPLAVSAYRSTPDTGNMGCYTVDGMVDAHLGEHSGAAYTASRLGIEYFGVRDWPFVRNTEFVEEPSTTD